MLGYGSHAEVKNNANRMLCMMLLLCCKQKQYLYLIRSCCLNWALCACLVYPPRYTRAGPGVLQIKCGAETALEMALHGKQRKCIKQKQSKTVRAAMLLKSFFVIKRILTCFLTCCDSTCRVRIHALPYMYGSEWFLVLFCKILEQFLHLHPDPDPATQWIRYRSFLDLPTWSPKNMYLTDRIPQYGGGDHMDQCLVEAIVKITIQNQQPVLRIRITLIC